MPLGIFEDRTWAQRIAQVAPGDMLVLYTDGITEARDGRGTCLGADRLLETARAHLDLPAQSIQDAILLDIHGFVGDTPQSDDIALGIIVRDQARETDNPDSM
jgi:sigma-B regulation protein RsbU (phosphoserine phosphatase)